MKLRLAKRAQQHIAKIETFWIDERRDAPTLFTDELAETFRTLCSVPHAGSRWPTAKRSQLRRILMTRSQNHVYFVVDDSTKTVRVLAVSGAKKHRPPRL